VKIKTLEVPTNKKCSSSGIVNKLNKIIKVTNTHNHEEYIKIEQWQYESPKVHTVK